MLLFVGKNSLKQKTVHIRLQPGYWNNCFGTNANKSWDQLKHSSKVAKILIYKQKQAEKSVKKDNFISL